MTHSSSGFNKDMAYMRIQRSDSYNIFPTQDSRCRNVNIDQDGNINWTLTNDIYITFIIATNEMVSYNNYELGQWYF